MRKKSSTPKSSRKRGSKPPLQKRGVKPTSFLGIVIFDIDQTLVHAFPAHNEATNEVLQKVFGIDGYLPDVDYEGQSIRHNLFEIAHKHGINEKVIKAKIADALRMYDQAFDDALRSHHEKLAIPHATQAVVRAKQAGNALAVVTGGTAHVGTLLLKSIGIDELFDVKIFGTTSDHREVLVHKAIAVARKKAGWNVPKDRIVSVGDSVRDVDAAKANGIRVIAVLTGSTSSTTLKKHNPDHIVKDLSDPIVARAVGYVG